MAISLGMPYMNRVQKEITELEQKISADRKKAAQLKELIASIEKRLTKHTSDATLKSKQMQVARHHAELLAITTNLTNMTKQLSTKTADLAKYKQQSEQKKQ